MLLLSWLYKSLSINGDKKYVGSLYHRFYGKKIKIEMDFIDLIVSYQTR